MSTPAPYIFGNTVAACVLNENGIDFLDMVNGLSCSPKALYVPTKASDLKFDNYDRWAVPISDNGVFTGFDYNTLRTGQYYLTPPTVDSLPCFLIKEPRTSKYWYIFGELTDLMAAASVQSGGTVILMQGIVQITDPFNSPRQIFAVDPTLFPKVIIPQVSINQTNDGTITYFAAGVNYTTVALPTLSGSLKYFPQGIINNVFLPTAPTTYSTPAALLTYLNANYTNGGEITWYLDSTNSTLFATGFTLGDNFGTVITAV